MKSSNNKDLISFYNKHNKYSKKTFYIIITEKINFINVKFIKK